MKLTPLANWSHVKGQSQRTYVAGSLRKGLDCRRGSDFFTAASVYFRIIGRLPDDTTSDWWPVLVVSRRPVAARCMQ